MFFLKMRVYLLIDSPMLVCNQLRRWMGQIDYSFDQRGYVSQETVVGGDGVLQLN